MKRLKISFLALLICELSSLCLACNLNAVEYSIKGIWINLFELGHGGNFVKKNRQGLRTSGWGRWGEDDFEVKTRVRLQFDAIASENLSGSLYFEIGALQWGRANRGGALGADSSSIIKLKHAYLDWLLPGTKIRTRMGIQRIFLPDYASEASQVLDADVAGISLSVPLNDMAEFTFFWARPLNDNWLSEKPDQSGYLDNADMFALVLPLTFDGFRMTPWMALGMAGKNTFRSGDDYYGNGYGVGMGPAWYALRNDLSGKNAYAYGTSFWTGLTGDLSALEPLNLAWSFNYGNFDSGIQALNSRGCYAAGLAEYKFDWGTPGIYGWYSSGDDGNPKNGSEHMPSYEYNNESTSGLSAFGTLGTWTIGRDAVIGYTLAGTWGLGMRLKDFSFMDKLKQTFRVNFYSGTNSPAMAKYIKGEYDMPGHRHFSYGTDFYNVNPNGGIFLTQRDYAVEFGLLSNYQMYENFRILMEANYVTLALDQSSSVWGGFVKNGKYVHADSIEDARNINLSFIYRF